MTGSLEEVAVWLLNYFWVLVAVFTTTFWSLGLRMSYQNGPRIDVGELISRMPLLFGGQNRNDCKPIPMFNKRQVRIWIQNHCVAKGCDGDTCFRNIHIGVRL